ncbi:MAG TPA: hypothetical protein VKM94_23640 [Blastocatellia bacterium]|nr:hypothetical protein [Blastocatellia bacterium]
MLNFLSMQSNQSSGSVETDQASEGSVARKRRFTKKTVIAAAAIATAAIAATAYIALRRPPLVPMERYIPAQALAYLQVDSLADVTRGLTGTIAWREIAPLLGISSQWQQAASAAELIGNTGLGPDEAVLVARAQCAVVVTDLEVDSGSTEEGPFVHLTPRASLVIETHFSPERAARLVRERAPLIASRLFGDINQTTESYKGQDFIVLTGRTPRQVLVAASIGSVVILANGYQPARVCADSIAGRTPTLSNDSSVQTARSSVARDSSVFAFVTRAGLQKLVQLAPIMLGRETSAESVGAAVSLLEHLAEQAADGVSYSAEFVEGGVREKYLWSLERQVAEGIAEAAKASRDRPLDLLAMVPDSVPEVTLVNIDGLGALPERLLEQLAPRVDVVIALALRELVISLRKEYGLTGSQKLDDAIGSELVLIDFGDGESRAMLFRVLDRSKLDGPLKRYLSKKAGRVSSRTEDGVEILTGDDEEGKAAAFSGEFLILGTQEQIKEVLGPSAHGAGGQGSAVAGIKKVLGSAPATASMVSYRESATAAGDFMLSVSKLLRVTDGSKEILARQEIRDALSRLPRAKVFTEFRDSGIYTESWSPIGRFQLLSSE